LRISSIIKTRRKKPDIDPRYFLTPEYHDFPDIFSKKKNIDIFLEYNPNNFSFTPKNKAEYKDSRGYPFILPEDRRIRDYIITYLSKGFITISLVLYIVLILFVKKPSSRI
jgi:hypothetical protein